jgi:hypothetical protein
MSGVGQNRKSSMRAYVFRFAPESGHCATQSACLKSAMNGSHKPIQSPRQRLARRGRGDFQAERFRRLEVDDERVPGGLLNSAARERLGRGDLNMADMAQGALFILACAFLYGLTVFLFRDQIKSIPRRLGH